MRTGEPFSLSRGERAGVRGKVVAIKPRHFDYDYDED
jgi:hypothetical protein